MPRYLSLLLLLAVAGCGFQLRDAGLTGSPELQLVSSPRLAAVRRTIEDRLELSGARIGSTGPVIALMDERRTRRPVSTSSVVDAAQYEIRLEVDVTIEPSAGAPLETTLVAERIYAVDAVNLMGSYEEQSLLMTEMQEEIARQLVRLLEATRVANGDGPGAG